MIKNNVNCHPFKPTNCGKDVGNAPLTLDKNGVESPLTSGQGEIVAPNSAFRVTLVSEAPFEVYFANSVTEEAQDGKFYVPANELKTFDIGGFSTGVNFCDTVVVDGTDDVYFYFDCYTGDGV